MNLFGYREHRERVPGSTVHDYRRVFRFSEENVVRLCDEFLGHENIRRGHGLTRKEKMECFLRYVGDPGFQINVGEKLRVNQGTISRAVHEVTTKICQKAADWITFPRTDREMARKQEQWLQKFNHPHCIGVIDGSLVPIKRPPANCHPDEYVCRKGFTAINTLVVCDSVERFMYVDVKWPGCTHDARVFSLSSIKPKLEQFQDSEQAPLLLGDSGFSIAPYMMVPFRNPVTEREKNYNRLLVKERVIIERVIGQWKRRFPILLSPIRIKFENIPSIILATAVLHNVAKTYADDIEEQEDMAIHMDMENRIGGEEYDEQVQYLRINGQARRRRISESMV